MTTAYTASNNVPLAALPNTNGIVQKFLASVTNPSDATFAPDGLTAAPVFGLGGLQLQGNEIVAGGIATVVSYIGPLLNSSALCWVLLECEGGAQQVGNASHPQHAISTGQALTGSLGTATAAGTANAVTASYPASPAAFSSGQPFVIISSASNTGAVTAVLTLGGVAQSSVPVVKANNIPLAAGDFPAGYVGQFSYNATSGALVLNNPAATIASSVPPGTIIDFAGTTAPAGYLVCPTTQTNVSRTTYASLFAAIGTTWGAGDGSTTFGLPWFPIDYVASQANGNVGTRFVGEVISHTHPGLYWRNNGGPNAGPPAGSEVDPNGAVANAGGAANLAASVRLLKCIKT